MIETNLNPAIDTLAYAIIHERMVRQWAERPESTVHPNHTQQVIAEQEAFTAGVRFTIDKLFPAEVAAMVKLKARERAQ